MIEKAELIVLVEGAPDWLAAWDIIYHSKRWDIVPLAMLGRTLHALHPDALKLLKNKRVRFVPHADADGGALEQVALIGDQLRKAGCEISVFDLVGLRTPSGKPAKDLNDVIRANGRVGLAESLLCKYQQLTN